ncbi:MAG: RHS repeat-associated core domain-containing protein, partial [Bacteroidota bacterium]|nr:RHS repeat-associated core domain-containing protein [Bacteroidota bacterium]
LGVYNINRDLVNPTTGEITTFERGRKFFELSNHLQNVLVTISDKKIGVDNNSDGIIDYYNADVISAQDYAPFGSLLPGRQYGTKGRYLFNGKEQDPEVKGSGAQYDYGFRIYDPRLGRFLSTDPLMKGYPMLTPYQFASNRPIDGIDLDGLEYYTVHVNREYQGDGTEKFTVTSVEDHTKMTEAQFGAVHGRSDKYNYKEYSKSFGSRGRGVLYVYTYTFKGGGEYASQTSTLDVSQNNFIADTKRHGIWSGPGSLTKYGSGAGEDRKKNPYMMDDPKASNAIFKPVDEVDYAAYLHDRAENQPDFKSHYEARWLDADITFVAQLELYLDRVKNPNYKDEFTGRASSSEAINSAEKAIKYFMGNIPGIIKPVMGKAKNGEIPPKAKEKGITMEEVRNRIDTKKSELQKAGTNF